MILLVKAAYTAALVSAAALAVSMAITAGRHYELDKAWTIAIIVGMVAASVAAALCAVVVLWGAWLMWAA